MGANRERGRGAAAPASEAEDGNVVLAAICENKAREVGLAVFETGTAVLHLQQYVESYRHLGSGPGQQRQFSIL